MSLLTVLPRLTAVKTVSASKHHPKHYPQNTTHKLRCFPGPDFLLPASSLPEIIDRQRENPEYGLEGVQHGHKAPEHIAHDLPAQHVFKAHGLVDGG
jgi:hypothetical protein